MPVAVMAEGAFSFKKFLNQCGNQELEAPGGIATPPVYGQLLALYLLHNDMFAVLQVSLTVETPHYHVVNEACRCDSDEFVVGEFGEFNDIQETCSCSYSVSCETDVTSAVLLAKELYRVFQKCWMLSAVKYQLGDSVNARDSIVVNEENVRKDYEFSMDIVQDVTFKSRMRGTEDWTPP